MPLPGLRRAAWSHLPAPTEITATNTSTSGGGGTITGLNFVSGVTASVNISGTPTALTIVFVNAQTLTYTLPAGSYTAGQWYLTVTNPDGQFSSNKIFQINATSDPQTVLGASLLAWYKADAGVTQASNLVSQWNDQTTNANHLAASGSAKPTYNPSSANGFNAMPTITFDGVANALTSIGNGPNLGGTTNTLFVYIVCRTIAGTLNRTYLQLGGAGAGVAFFQVGSLGFLAFRNVAGAPASANLTANPTSAGAVYGVMTGTAASAEVASINIANMTEITGTTGNGAEPATGSPIGPIYVGATSGTSAFANFEIAEIVVANKKPNSSDLLALYQYFNFKYTLDPTISFTGAMDVLATTGTESRIAGAGFNSTTTCSVVVSGTPTSVSTTYLNQGSISLSSLPSLSAGSYDLIITNGNSDAALSVSAGLTATTVKKPDTILGRKLITWARADQVALNTGNVAAFTDLARIGNAIAQSIGANQPAWTSSNANFAGKPTVTFAGTPQEMKVAANQFDTGTHTEWMCTTYRCSTSAGTQTLALCPDGVRSTSSGGGILLIRARSTGAGASWGVNDINITQSAYAYNQFVSTGVYNSGINVAAIGAGWGTEVVSSNQTGFNALTNDPLFVGSSGGSGYLIGDIAEVIVCDGIPTSGQLSDLATYLGRY